MIYRIEGSLHQGWSEALLFTQRYDEFYFFIHHPNNLMAPPAANPSLGAADASMVASFESHLNDMNLIVAASQARARETPLPAPTSPDSRLFVRITADWSRDTDDDGTPDWMEFASEASGSTAGSGEPEPNPMDADTNSNGIPDGEETDADGDGVANRFDVAPNDELLNWEKSEEFRFAWFEADAGTGSESTYPIHINDNGSVLYSGSIWKNGASHSLNPTNGGSLRDCRPIGMSDNGAILGTGEINLPGNANEAWRQCMVTWQTSGGAPVALRFDSKYLFPIGIPEQGVFGVTSLVPSDIVLNDSGDFIALLATPILESGPNGDTYTLLPDPDRKKWRITPQTFFANGQVAEGVDVSWENAAWVGGDGAIWGTDEEGRLKTGSTTFDFPHDRFSRLPGDRPVVFAGYKLRDGPFAQEVGGIPHPRIFDEEWKPSVGLDQQVDYSPSGGFGIGRRNNVWFNGRIRSLEKMSPGIPESMKVILKNRIIDTTTHGWTLAVRDGETAYNTHVGTPIRLSQPNVGRGLDDLSLAARKGVFETPDQQSAVKDEFWVMVPAGGEVTVTIESAASTASPLEIGSAEVMSDPASINTRIQEIELSAPASAAGTEVVVPLKLGGVASASNPIRAKIMKPRVVEVSVWPLKRPGQPVGNPAKNLSLLPTEEVIEDFLADKFEDQINATFNVTIQPESELTTDPGDKFIVANEPNQTMLEISANRKVGNIQVYVLGWYDRFDVEEPSELEEDIGYGGWSTRDAELVWLQADQLIYNDAEKKATWLTTLSHEIGHVIIGFGHPNDGGGPAPLTGVDNRLRLMHNGLYKESDSHFHSLRRILVKREWDLAEDWLERKIDSN